MGESSPLELADIVRRFGKQFRERHHGHLPRHHLRVLQAVEQCRTPALGGHLYQCDHCATKQEVYNSCGNRHCPKCQSLERQRWLEKRSTEVLPVEYFHVVFTVPEQLNPLIWRNQELLYNLLFRCASQTLLRLGADPKHLGARLGFWAVLHTWGQTLTEHPHIHCLVPGGGISLDGQRWISCRPGYLLPVAVLQSLFRGLFLSQLREMYQAGKLAFPGQIEALQEAQAFQTLLDSLYAKTWRVYSKPPFDGPDRMLRYLARYTHRVAISNSRLVRLEGDRLTFTYKDYAQGGRVKEMTLAADEFLRRFLLHILPDRFVRLRSYGFLANRCRDPLLTLCQQLLQQAPPAAAPEVSRQGWRETVQRLTGRDPTVCPHCGQGHWILRGHLPRQRPPPQSKGGATG